MPRAPIDGITSTITAHSRRVPPLRMSNDLEDLETLRQWNQQLEADLAALYQEQNYYGHQPFYDVYDGRVVPSAMPPGAPQWDAARNAMDGEEMWRASQGYNNPPNSAEEDLDPNSVKGLLKRVKDAGVAGAISYAGWELAFWAASVPVCLAAYYGVTGHLPDLTDQEDIAKLSAEAFAFVNLARFAVPLRIGLALSTVPWVQSNIIDRFTQQRSPP